jgi:diketogulonate reductase-like aldo/keto reductase
MSAKANLPDLHHLHHFHHQYLHLHHVMPFTRRDFLRHTAVVTGTAAVAGAVLAPNAMATSKPVQVKAMVTRKIASAPDGETLPVIGMGTWNTFDVGTSSEDRAPLLDVLKVFYESGARVIDSSPMYGEAERTTGDLVQQIGKGAQTFFATKVWTSGRDKGIAQIDQSFRLLRTARLDLLQIHNLLDWRTHAATLRDLKSRGKLRYTGVTHYSVSAHDDLRAVLQAERFDFAQFNYSIATREAERTLLPFCQEHGIAVLINRPFEEGALFTQVRGRKLPGYAAEFDCKSWAQFFLKYILSHPAVTCVIPATSRVTHMRDNIQAGFGRLPNEKMRARMAKELEV